MRRFGPDREFGKGKVHRGNYFFLIRMRRGDFGLRGR
jgi:hypothetical protein